MRCPGRVPCKAKHTPIPHSEHAPAQGSQKEGKPYHEEKMIEKTQLASRPLIFLYSPKRRLGLCILALLHCPSWAVVQKTSYPNPFQIALMMSTLTYKPRQWCVACRPKRSRTTKRLRIWHQRSRMSKRAMMPCLSIGALIAPTNRWESSSVRKDMDEHQREG